MVIAIGMEREKITCSSPPVNVVKLRSPFSLVSTLKLNRTKIGGTASYFGYRIILTSGCPVSQVPTSAVGVIDLVLIPTKVLYGCTHGLMSCYTAHVRYGTLAPFVDWRL